MKKIMIMVTVVSLLVALVGCSNPFRTDTKHATVTLTTSTGETTVFQTYNGAGFTISGREFALRNKIKGDLNKGGTAKITFKCDECGDKQEIEVTEPFADVLHCKCPEKIDKKGNAREYIAIEVSFGDGDKAEK